MSKESAANESKEQFFAEFAKQARGVLANNPTVNAVVELRQMLVANVDRFLDDPQSPSTPYLKLSREIYDKAEELGMDRDSLDAEVYARSQGGDEVEIGPDATPETGASSSETSTRKISSLDAEHAISLIDEAEDLEELHRLTDSYAEQIPDSHLAKFEQAVANRIPVLERKQRLNDLDESIGSEYTQEDIATPLILERLNTTKDALDRRRAVIDKRRAEERSNNAKKIAEEITKLSPRPPEYTVEDIEQWRRESASATLKAPSENPVRQSRQGIGGALRRAAVGVLAFFGLSDAGKIAEVRVDENIKPKQTATLEVDTPVREPIVAVSEEKTERPPIIARSKNNETKIRKDASAWRAAKRLAPEDDFAEAWANKESKVLLADGSEVHISKLNLTHEGDTIRYIPGKSGRAGHFEFDATSGYEPGLEVAVE